MDQFRSVRLRLEGQVSLDRSPASLIEELCEPIKTYTLEGPYEKFGQAIEELKKSSASLIAIEGRPRPPEYRWSDWLRDGARGLVQGGGAAAFLGDAAAGVGGALGAADEIAKGSNQARERLEARQFEIDKASRDLRDAWEKAVALSKRLEERESVAEFR